MVIVSLNILNAVRTQLLIEIHKEIGLTYHTLVLITRKMCVKILIDS